MKPYQKEFIEFALANDVLRFGSFTMKSGRVSPYFFNAGMFKDGEAFARISDFYARAIHDDFQADFDLLFGPAYKGIPLATCASIGLRNNFNTNVAVSFNRKEAKDHGEGGMVIGTPLKDKRILLVDDVITAGTTIRESVELATKEGGKIIGIVIALDRQERGLRSNRSAIQEIEQEFGVKVVSIIKLDDLVEYLSGKGEAEYLPSILQYRLEFSAV